MNKLKILVVANNCKWESWAKKLDDLSNWFEPNFDISFYLRDSSFTNIPFVRYNEQEKRNQTGIDPVWYDENITKLAIGFDMVMFVMNTKEWQGFGVKGWRTDSDQGIVQLQVCADEEEKTKWPNFPKMDTFFQVARHEICHGLFMLSGQYDMTHYYWDRGELEKARDMVVLKPKYQIPFLIRTIGYLKFLLTKISIMDKKLLEKAIEKIGHEVSPTDLAPDEFGCAEGVSNIIRMVEPSFPVITGTWTLWQTLKNSPLFKEIKVPAPGCVVIYPTGAPGGGKNGIANGHVGIVGKGGAVMSNDSNDGLWKENYTLDTMKQRYLVTGGYPAYYFIRLV